MASKTVFPFVGGCYFVLVLIPPSDFYCFLEPYFILSILFAIEGAFQGKNNATNRAELFWESEKRRKETKQFSCNIWSLGWHVLWVFALMILLTSHFSSHVSFGSWILIAFYLCSIDLWEICCNICSRKKAMPPKYVSLLRSKSVPNILIHLLNCKKLLFAPFLSLLDMRHFLQYL